MQIILLVFYVLSVPLIESKAEKCLRDLPDTVAKKRFKLTIDSTLQTISLQLHYSRHVSQQISTHILKILAEEVLGYEGIHVVDDSARFVVTEDVLKTLSGCPGCRSTSGQVPVYMVDTEVWLPLGYQNTDLLDKGLVLDAGLITELGWYGWYMPTSFVQEQWTTNNIVADHWRSLSIDSILHLLKTNLGDLHNVQNLTEIKEFCGGRKTCAHRISSVGGCDGLSSSCVVVLADFPGEIDSYTTQLIQGLSLNLSVFWLGSNLPETITKYLKHPGKPFLLLNWEPNTLTSTGNLTRVLLPPCSYGPTFLDKNVTIGCDYPLTHLKKLAWSKVKTGAPDFYHLLEKLYLPKGQLKLLLHEHKDSGGTMNSHEAACHWLRQKRSVWLSWLPSGLHSGRIPVYLGGMFPMKQNDDALWVRPGILTGATMALKKINEDSSILSNYSLNLITKNTQCQTPLVLNSYIQFVSPHRKYTLAGILGPACSIQAEIVAEVSPFYNTIIIGYSLEGVNLANRKKYPLFFRTSPSYFEFKKAYSAIFYAFDWKQYAALTDVNYASATVTAIHEYLADKDIKLVYSRFIALQESADIQNYLKSIQKSNARIIIGHMFEDVAREVVCEAIKQGMTPQNGYVWFLPSWLRRQWYIYNSSHLNHNHRDSYTPLIKCTEREMIHFIKGGYFSLDNSFFARGNTNVVGGYSIEQWKEVYKKKVKVKGYPTSNYASFAYDAVWAYAYALDRLFKNYPSSLDTMRTNLTTQRLKRYLQESNFTGVSGRVSFKDGERYLPTVNIVQHFDKGSPVTIGQFMPVSPGQRICAFHEGCLKLNETLIKWPGNKRPSDGRPDHTSKRSCPVESFRKLTGLSCDWAIAVINIIAIGLFLIVVITLIWLCIKTRYDKKYKRTRKRMEELGLMYQSPIMQLDDWEIPREDVVLNRKLGEGAFGTVFGGEAKGLGEQSEWMPVAVKTLKVGSSLEEKLEFLSEAETMKVFNHKNIVMLLGVCTKGEPSLAVMELMIHGDLKSFLLARRQFVSQSCKEAEDVTPAQLTNMALEIASGLEYLSNLKYVHRDLALRNCMVGSGRVVKLGDFGMTRAMYDSDYYRFGRKGMLPVRWMAPESLADGVFTTKSDVWGLGVTMWELCTLGSFPYQGLSNSEVVVFVKEDKIMIMPRDCTSQLADLLHQCWRADPNERPEPITIIDILNNNDEMITPCLDAPIASIAADDDLLDTESITADKPPSPRLISRKFSRSLKAPTRSPRSSLAQKLSATRQLSVEQLNTMIDSLTPPGSPSLVAKKQRKEEFV